MRRKIVREWQVKKGMRVWWDDPEGGSRSSPGTVLDLERFPTGVTGWITVQRDDGGIEECRVQELSHMWREFFWCWTSSSLLLLLPCLIGPGFITRPSRRPGVRKLISKEMGAVVKEEHGFLVVIPHDRVLRRRVVRDRFEKELFPLLEQVYGCARGRRVGRKELAGIKKESVCPS